MHFMFLTYLTRKVGNYAFYSRNSSVCGYLYSTDIFEIKNSLYKNMCGTYTVKYFILV